MIDPIVSSSWLSEHRAAVVVCDVRASLAGGDSMQAFLDGHLAGAVFVDLETVLAARPAPLIGRHPLPAAEDFATSLGALGIDNNTTVIAYDTNGGAFASRLVWMLRILGQPAALLDGGLVDWTEELEQGPVGREAVDRRARPWPDDAIADADGVAAHIAAGGVVLDSRTRPRYLGEIEPIDATAGHVPGAVNVPFNDNLDDRAAFRPNEELRVRFEAVDADEQAIVYCGSGVTACHNALAMEAAGLGLPRIYVGSWSGWSSDPDRPVATGPEQ